MIPASPEVQAEAVHRAALANVPETERATEASMDAAPLHSWARDRDGDSLVKLADGWHYFVPHPSAPGEVLIVEDTAPIAGLLMEYSPVRIVREGPA